MAYRLYAELGHTNLHVGYWQEGWAADFRVRTRDVWGGGAWERRCWRIFNENPPPDAICDGGLLCASRSDPKSFRKALSAAAGAHLRLLGSEVKLDLPVAYDDPSTFGPDRLLAAFSAQEHVGAPYVVFDAGTCITCDAVSAAGRVEPLAIAPGLNVLLAGMESSVPRLTEALEGLDAAGVQAPPGPAASTRECIRLGIRGELLGMLRELVSAAREAVGGGHEVPVVVTGGDGELVAALLGPPARHLPMLALDGLRLLDQRARP